MTKAEIYRKAAQRSLLTGDGLQYLEKYPVLLKEFWHYHNALPGILFSTDEFCMALCMLAAVHSSRS